MVVEVVGSQSYTWWSRHLGGIFEFNMSYMMIHYLLHWPAYSSVSS